MSGGKGGSTSTELPGYLQDFQKENMANARLLAELGYSPYTGPEVAAVNPWEELAAVNQGQMSKAFNMGAPDGSIASRMPEVVTAPDGSSGYSSFPIFNQAVSELQNVAPAYDARYKSLMGLPKYSSRGGVYNTPSYGDPYAGNTVMQAIRDAGGVAPQEPAVDPQKLLQLGSLLSSRGHLSNSSGSNMLQGLANMSSRGLMGMM